MPCLSPHRSSSSSSSSSDYYYYQILDDGGHHPSDYDKLLDDDDLAIASQRRIKLERLRRKLGDDVPASAVFPPRSLIRGRIPTPDDPHPIAFSINSDESVHTVSLTTRVRTHPPHPPQTRYHVGALPPIPVQLLVEEDVGPRQKMTAGSTFGGSDFKAARRAKREGKKTAEPGELVEIVGFLR